MELLKKIGKQKGIAAFLISSSVFITVWYLFLFFSKAKNVIPFPHQVFKKLDIILFNEFLIPFLLTTFRTIIGFIIGCFFAVVVGYLTFKSKFLRQTLYLPIDFIRTLPSIALLPLVLLFVQPDGPIHITMIILSVFFIMTISVITGFDSVEKLRITMAEKMGLTKTQIFKKIEFNEALPNIISGMRISISVALIIDFMIEYYFPSKSGVGAYISLLNGNINRVDEMSAGLIYLGLLGFAINQLFIFISNKYCNWKE